MQPGRRWADERGSASLEFVTVGMIMLVPLVYLVLAVSSIQAGAMAAEGAARHGARVFVQARDTESAAAAANRALQFALADHGLQADAAALAVSCQPTACLTRGARVTVTVSLTVPLPLVPPALFGDFPLTVPITSSATQQVSRFWGSG